MDDLVQFLRARLDEDELLATEASRRGTGKAVPGGVHWQWEDDETDEVIVPDPGVDEFVAGGMSASLRSRETWPTESGVGDLPQFAIPYAQEVPAAVGVYIARHDPARVLREVEAKLRRLVTYEAACRRRDAEAEDYQVWSQGKAPSERPTFEGPDPALIPGLEYAVREDAQVYSDHPDYREEWRP